MTARRSAGSHRPYPGSGRRHDTEPVTLRASDGVDLALFVDGPPEATTVVFVHGYPDDHTLWDPVIDDLSADHRCVAYDVRGAGRSGVPEGRDGWRMERLLDDLDLVIDHVSADRPVHLVAHDWGSIQGWAYVLDPHRRRRVASFTSMSGPPLHHVRPWIARQWHRGPPGWLVLVRQAGASLYIAFFQTALAPVTWRRVLGPRWPKLVRAQRSTTDDRWPAMTAGEDAARGVELYRAQRRAMLPPFRADRLPAVEPPTEVPVLLLVSLDDQSVTAPLLDGPEDYATDLTRREMHGGHWLARTHPATVASEIRSLVARTHDPTPEPDR